MDSSTPPKGVLQKIEDFTFENLFPGATGIVKSALSGGGDIVQALSNGFQRQRTVGLLRAFISEWDKFVVEGKADPKFTDSEIGQQSFQELFDSLDKDLPDAHRAEAMRILFFKAASAKTDDATKSKIAQLMKICRQLDGTELLILAASYREYLRTQPKETIRGAEDWPSAVATASKGTLSAGTVEHYEDLLIEKKVIAGRIHSDKSGIGRANAFRLTNLGIELGELLSG